MLTRIRSLLRPLINTPVHPQWLLGGGKQKLENLLQRIEPGSIVLDIGCYDKWAVSVLPEKCVYFGLDYPLTSKDWYGTAPDIYADALHLPIKSGSVDVVLLFDVLEHLPDPQRAIQEIRRVLRPEGQVLIQVPFLYPLHDQPLDFTRYTEHAYRQFANTYGFSVEECNALGHPIETATLLFNIALSKTVANWIKQRSLASLFVIAVPMLVLLGNLSARLIRLVSRADDFMPYSYQLRLCKQ